jgi:threonylcarbamoyladenosine tRNA methylthiotransferase MtaB
MRTFSVQTLGCKVNQYESEQIAALLRSHGFDPAESPQQADLRIINTCSVTLQAAAKSRQTIRRTTPLRVLQPAENNFGLDFPPDKPRGQRTIVTGCYATSDRSAAEKLPGVDAVLTHYDDVAAGLHRLIRQWFDDAGTLPRSHPDDRPASISKTSRKEAIGTHRLPLLGERQSGHQRAMLKVQDGCDAHCTYCIIPSLRPGIWSKPVEEVVAEARRLVDSGHVELVLTGIFLGAYGQATALRHRQDDRRSPLGLLIQALCREVAGLKRLRLSSLEPGDLSAELLEVMTAHEQVVPHFHLPLQSGSDLLLRRMNRQYRQRDFLEMIDRVRDAYDRPAITTDIIVGFPGETDEQFEQTLRVVDHAQFIHTHAFSFSPRPGTAAARWTDEFVHGPIVNQRINHLTHLAAEHSAVFRRRFIGETVQVLVERPRLNEPLRHGRCERYFDVSFDDPGASAGDLVPVTIEQVDDVGTWGVPLSIACVERPDTAVGR